MCLTLVNFKNDKSQFYLSKETFNKSNFRKARIKQIVNLEKSIKFGSRLSGHFVQGHVDTTAIIKKIESIGKSWCITFMLAKKFKNYIVQKGSVSINGVSLAI